MFEAILSFGTLGTSLVLALLIVFAAARVSRKKYVPASTLIVERFSILPDAVDEPFIRVVGRYKGILSWLLTNLRIGNRVEMTVKERDLTLRGSSLSGMSVVYVPLTKIRSTVCGYQHSLLALFFTIFFGLNAAWNLVGTIPILIKTLADHSEASREAAATNLSILLFLAFFWLLVGGIALLFFYLSKRVVFAVDSGNLHGLAFKRSMVENAVIDLAEAERATVLLNRLVEAAVYQIPLAKIPQPPPSIASPLKAKPLLGWLVAASSLGILSCAFLLFWYGKGVVVRITTTPVGAPVFVDDHYAGRTTKEENAIVIPRTTREDHTFVSGLDGYETFKHVVRVGGLLSTQDVAVQLTLKKYPVTIYTNPTGSHIALDGKDLGVSNETGLFAAPEVEHGTHQIAVSHDGFRTQTESVEILRSRESFRFVLVNEAEAARQEVESRQREIAGHLDRGRAFFRQGQYQQALDECEAVLKLDATNAGATALKNQIEQTRKILGQ